jgi:hypothetical protein
MGRVGVGVDILVGLDVTIHAQHVHSSSHVAISMSYQEDLWWQRRCTVNARFYGAKRSSRLSTLLDLTVPQSYRYMYVRCLHIKTVKRLVDILTGNETLLIALDSRWALRPVRWSMDEYTDALRRCECSCGNSFRVLYVNRQR